MVYIYNCVVTCNFSDQLSGDLLEAVGVTARIFFESVDGFLVKVAALGCGVVPTREEEEGGGKYISRAGFQDGGIHLNHADSLPAFLSSRPPSLPYRGNFLINYQFFSAEGAFLSWSGNGERVFIVHRPPLPPSSLSPRQCLVKVAMEV